MNLTERGNGYLSMQFEAAPKDGGFKIMRVKQVWDLWPAEVELIIFHDMSICMSAGCHKV